MDVAHAASRWIGPKLLNTHWLCLHLVRERQYLLSVPDMHNLFHDLFWQGLRKRAWPNPAHCATRQAFGIVIRPFSNTLSDTIATAQIPQLRQAHHRTWPASLGLGLGSLRFPHHADSASAPTSIFYFSTSLPKSQPQAGSGSAFKREHEHQLPGQDRWKPAGYAGSRAAHILTSAIN